MSDRVDDDVDPEIEALLRRLDTADLEQGDPPTGLWDRIEAEVEAEAEVEQQDASQSDAPSTGPDQGATVIRLDDRRRFRSLSVVAAVAAAVIVLVAGAAVVVSRSGSTTTVVATAELTYDETFDELGVSAVAGAELVQRDDGSAEVRIVGASLPDPTGEPADLELWLIEPDADGNVADLVSLGLVDPSSPGVYEVPAGYDAETFFVVDISVEPRDGQPAHSGRSILRGPLVLA